MGMLLGRSWVAEHDLPASLRDSCVTEAAARESERLFVLGCPRCGRRLCAVGRGTSASSTDPGTEEAASQLTWLVPSHRLERSSWLGGGGLVLRCRSCGFGKGIIEVGSTESIQEVLPALRSIAFWSNRPIHLRAFSICVCGIYDSIVSRAVALFEAAALAQSRATHVGKCLLRRSELVKQEEVEAALPTWPLELLVVVHKISGQRSPLTDSHGLYGPLLSAAWSRADVVLLLLLDLPRSPGGGADPESEQEPYFLQLLREQPTLLRLFSCGRLLPLFQDQEQTLEEAPESQAEASSTNGHRADTSVEAAWWLQLCLDGRVPKAPPTILGAADGGSGTEAWAAAEEAAKTAALLGSPQSALAHLAEGFTSQLLVRD